MKNIIISISFAAFLFFSPSIHAEESKRVPKKGTIISGSCLLGTSYLIFAIAALNVPGGESVAIPFVGPLIQIGKEKPPAPGVFLYSSMTFTELLGLALIIRGAIGDKKDPVVKVYPYIIQGGLGCLLSLSLPSGKRK